MKFVSVCFVLIATVTIYAQDTEEKHKIDIELENCLNDEFNHTTVAMMYCIDDALNAWDEELNRVYKELMTFLSTDQKNVLRSAQKEWIKFRDLEYNNINSIYDFEGTMWGQVRLMKMLNIVKDRTMTISDYLNAYK